MFDFVKKLFGFGPKELVQEVPVNTGDTVVVEVVAPVVEVAPVAEAPAPVKAVAKPKAPTKTKAAAITPKAAPKKLKAKKAQ